MFSTSSTILSSSTSSGSTSSTATEILSTVQSQSFEEGIPLRSREAIERKLASILTQIQQNQINHLDLTSTSLGYSYELANILKGHKREVCSLAVLPNGLLASASYDNSIKLWDLALHSCLDTLEEHTSSVLASAVLPNNQVAIGYYDTTIKLWDLASHSCLSTLKGHTLPVLALAALPNNQLASSSQDNTIKLWDLASNSCLFTLQGHAFWIWTLIALPNGQLASGSGDATIKLWDLSSHSCLATLKGHTKAVFALTALPNSRIASGSWDATIKLWDLTSNSCLATLKGHTNGVLALTALPNGKLASGSLDKIIKLWDLASHSCLSDLQEHTSWIQVLIVLPNGLLASGSADNTIKLWESKTLSVKQLTVILNALKNNTSVVDLDMSGNRDILDDLVDPLIAVFTPDTSSGLKSSTSLKTIDLRGTGVSQQGVKKLEKAIQHQRLSIEIWADCPIEWKMIYFLIIFCRANHNSRFADSGLDICKHELRPFWGVPSCLFVRPSQNLSAGNSSKRVALSLS